MFNAIKMNSVKNSKILLFFDDNRLLKNLFLVVFCFISGIFLLSPFLFSKTLFEGNDFLYHFNVIKALDEAFNNQQFFFKVLPSIANNFGYGTGYFYGTLPAKITVLVKNMFNCGYITAIKICVYFVFCFSGIIMYFFAFRVLKNTKKALFSSLLYVTFPYFISNLYVRFAYSELFIYMFIPMCIWGIYELLYLNNGIAFFVLFTVGLSAMIFSHLASAVWVCLVCLIIILVNFKKFFSGKRWLLFFLSCVIILCLTAYYTLPLIEHYLSEFSYRVSNPDIMVTSAFKVFEGSNFPQFYYNNYQFEQPIIPMFSIFPYISSVYYILIAFFAIRGLHKTKTTDKSCFLENATNKNDFNRKLLILFCAISVFIYLSMSKLSVWWFVTPSVFRMIQFSSRLLNIFAVIIVLTPTAYKSIKKPVNRKISLALTAGIMAYTTLIFSALYPTVAYKLVSENTLETNTIINRGCGDQFEYLLEITDPNYVRERNNVIFANPNNLDVKDAVLENEKNTLRFYLNAPISADKKISLKIPYDSNIIITQNAASFLNKKMSKYMGPELIEENQVFADWQQTVVFWQNNDNYIEFELENVDSIVTIDYSNSEIVKNFLLKNPFQFKAESGDINFSNFEKNGINYTVDVSLTTESVAELPTLYYSGYEFKLEKADGSQEAVDAYMNEKGFFEVKLKESGKLMVEWTGTKFVKGGKLLSLLGVALMGLAAVEYIVLSEVKKRLLLK